MLAEQKKHEDERGILLTKVDELQTASDKQATEIANLSTKIKQQEEDFTRQRETLTTIIREQRDQLEKKELILDRPDGYVTYVDYETARGAGQPHPPPGCSPADEDDDLRRRTRPAFPPRSPRGTSS